MAEIVHQRRRRNPGAINDRKAAKDAWIGHYAHNPRTVLQRRLRPAGPPWIVERKADHVANMRRTGLAFNDLVKAWQLLGQ